MINETITSATLELCNKGYVNFSFIIFFIFQSLVLLLTGILAIDRRKSNYIKFLIIWAIFILISTIFLIFIINSPETLYNFKSFLMNFK